MALVKKNRLKNFIFRCRDVMILEITILGRLGIVLIQKNLFCEMVNSERPGFIDIILFLSFIIIFFIPEYSFSENVAEYVRDDQVYTNRSPIVYIRIDGELTEFDMENYIRDFSRCYIIKLSYSSSRYGDLTQVIRYRPYQKWNYIRTESRVEPADDINSRKEVKNNVFGRMMDVKIDMSKQVVLASGREQGNPEKRSGEPGQFNIRVNEIECPESINKFDITKIFQRRDNFLNHYERYAFHSGKVSLPTTESIIERASLKNEYQIITPPELEFIEYEDE